jgi:hypothetical protein
MLNRERVRALVAVAKQSPTSSAVHVDTIMGGGKRRKKRRKPILQDMELDKAKFSSRSEAGRYAANMRWKGQGKGKGSATGSKTEDKPKPFHAGAQEYEDRRAPYRADPPNYDPYVDPTSADGKWDGISETSMGQRYATAPKRDKKESSTVRDFVERSKEQLDSMERSFGRKTLSGIGAYLRGEKYVGVTHNANAKDATEDDLKFGEQSFQEIKDFSKPLLAQAEKAIRDFDNGRADAQSTAKTLRSIRGKFYRKQKLTHEEQKAAGHWPETKNDNTVRSMTYNTKALSFTYLGERVDSALAQIVSEMRGKETRTMFDVGKYRVEKGESPAWQTKAGKNPKGGLNAKGRASYKRETGGTLKPPVKRGDNPRRASFLARMGNMPGPERDANGEPTRLLLSLQAWGASSKADARKKANAISARNKPKK